MLDSLELRVPPPLLSAIAALMMWLGSRSAVPFWRPDWLRGVTIATGVAGLVIIALAILSLRRASTTVSPTRPDRSRALVRTGVFRLSRNPIYLGALLVLLAFGLHLWQPQALVAVPLWAAWVHRFQILPEERHLRATFAEEFASYCAITRRWL
jgi:protein-S-isoprenylcysteine O-methyltransferase Ste14